MIVARAERERRATRTKRVPAQARRFGLLSEEAPASGFQRIALAQLDLAIEHLRGESSAAPREAVHETRKALKRVRAVMRLLEGELGVKRADRERALLRDAAARLAGARDAEVMVSTLDALVQRHPRELARRRGVIELRADLERERMRASARTLGDAAARERVAGELAEVRARVAKWRLPRNRSAAKLAAPGLERIYRAGRAGRRRAGRSSAAPRVLHRWRKHVKDLRYAAEALDVGEAARAHPGGPARERGSKPSRRQAKRRRRIARVARRADALGEMLGEEHDLMLLAERVRAHKRSRRARKRTRKRLLRAIARRRRRLRKRALREGERLYEDGPHRFVRKLRA